MKMIVVAALFFLNLSCQTRTSSVSSHSLLAARNFEVKSVPSTSTTGVTSSDYLISYKGSTTLKGLMITTKNPGAFDIPSDMNHAERQCADLEYAGFVGWRLPTRGEVRLLSDEGLILVGNGNSRLFTEKFIPVTVADSLEIHSIHEEEDATCTGLDSKNPIKVTANVNLASIDSPYVSTYISAEIDYCTKRISASVDELKFDLERLARKKNNTGNFVCVR